MMAASPIGFGLFFVLTLKNDITTFPFPAGFHIRLERGHPGGRPHAHQKSLLRRHLPQQPRHPVRLSRHEGEPAVALQKGTAEESRS